MELEVGGFYRLERKPMKNVKLFDRKTDTGRYYYQHSMNAKILVLYRPKAAIRRHRGIRYIVYFFEHGDRKEFVDCLYSVWIEKASFLKKQRDISLWPKMAKKHFLIAKGARGGTAKHGSIEDAQLEIARAGRRNRMEKEERKRRKEEASTKTIMVDIDHSNSTAALPTMYYANYTTAGSDWHQSIDEDLPSDPHTYDECELEEGEELPWLEEHEDDGLPDDSPLRPKPSPEPLQPGYIGKHAKFDGYGTTPKKRRKKKKRNARNKIRSFHDVERGSLQATHTTAAPKRSKGELLEIIENPSFTREFREQAATELDEMYREEKEIQALVDYANRKAKTKKKKKSDLGFSNWYDKQSKKEKETE